jgi:hypothetical protein
MSAARRSGLRQTTDDKHLKPFVYCSNKNELPMNQAGQPPNFEETNQGELLHEFRPGRIVTYMALGPAVLLLIIWLVVSVMWVTLVAQGEIDLFSLITMLPLTALTAGFVYFASYLWFYRLVVYRDGLVFRTVHRLESWKFNNLLDVRVETERTTSKSGPREKTFLYLMPKDTRLPSTRIPQFLNNRSIFGQAVRTWRAAINQMENQ